LALGEGTRLNVLFPLRTADTLTNSKRDVIPNRFSGEESAVLISNNETVRPMDSRIR